MASKKEDRIMEARPLPGGRVEIRARWAWYANRCAKLAADPTSGWEDLGEGEGGERVFSAPSLAFAPRRMRKGRPDAGARMRARHAPPSAEDIAYAAEMERWIESGGEEPAGEQLPNEELDAPKTAKPTPSPAPPVYGWSDF